MLKEQVRAYIKQEKMVEPGCAVLVGLSGGADSVALLLLLQELAEEMDFDLLALHVEHGIRGQESLEDADFAEALCRRLGIPCRRISMDVPAYAGDRGLGLEEAARILRYQALTAGADSLTRPARIALAHHMDDNAETILFHMTRGSGIRGLCGMEPVRRDEEGHIFIRPLLQTRRGEIEEYLSLRGQDYRTDSTNLEDEAARNRIRHHVLPTLEGINQEAVHHIAAGAAKLAEIDDYLKLQSDAAKAKLVRKEGDALYRISCRQLTELHPALAKPMILQLLAELAGSSRDLGEVHTAAVLGLCGLQSGRQLELPYEIRVMREYEDLIFTKKAKGDEAGHACSLPCVLDPKGGQTQITLPGWRFEAKIMDFSQDMDKIPKNKYTKWFDYDKIETGLILRTRRPGDYILWGPELHRKKLKRYFTDEKIPERERDAVLLLAKDQEILWVVGGRMGDHYKVSQDTRRILEICCETTQGGA